MIHWTVNTSCVLFLGGISVWHKLYWHWSLGAGELVDGWCERDLVTKLPGYLITNKLRSCITLSDRNNCMAAQSVCTRAVWAIGSREGPIHFSRCPSTSVGSDGLSYIEFVINIIPTLTLRQCGGSCVGSDFSYGLAFKTNLPEQNFGVCLSLSPTLSKNIPSKKFGVAGFKLMRRNVPKP